MPDMMPSSYYKLRTLRADKGFSTAIVEHVQWGSDLRCMLRFKGSHSLRFHWRKMKQIANNRAICLLKVKCKRYM